jgi:arsenate reductase-like glutaredoxin family protein
MGDSQQSVRFIWKKSCDTCRKYKKQLDAWKVDYVSREINTEPLSADDVDHLIGNRELKPFLNSHNAVYRELGLGKNPPERARAVELIAETNNLLRRPVLIVDEQYIVGNRLDEAAEALGCTR